MNQKPVIVPFKLSTIDSTSLFCQKKSDVDSHMIDLSAGTTPQGVAMYFQRGFGLSWSPALTSPLKTGGKWKLTKLTMPDSGRPTAGLVGRHGEKKHKEQSRQNEVRKYMFDAKSPVPSKSKTRKLLSSSWAYPKVKLHRTICNWDDVWNSWNTTHNYPLFMGNSSIYRPVGTSPITQYDMKTWKLKTKFCGWGGHGQMGITRWKINHFRTFCLPRPTHTHTHEKKDRKKNQRLSFFWHMYCKILKVLHLQ